MGLTKNLEDLQKELSTERGKRLMQASIDGCEQVVNECVNDPILREYAQKIQFLNARDKDDPAQNKKMPLGTPADVLGDRQLTRMLIAQGDFERWIPEDATDERRQIERLISPMYDFMIAEMIQRSIPYVWTEDMWMAAQTTKLPEHTVSREQMPFDHIWYTFPSAALGGEEVSMQQILLANEKEKISIYAFCIPNVGSRFKKPLVLRLEIPYGQRYPQDFSDNVPNLFVTSAVLSSLSILNSPFIQPLTRGLNRNERRRFNLPKFEFEPDTQKVRFIDLRQPVRVPMEVPEGAETVQWKYRWLVSGHHRAQWYPSLQGHKVIWIAPYVKGPESAPLKTAVRRVVR